MNLNDRYDFARSLCQIAGETALAYFHDRSSLQIDRKGAQDWVSEADRAVENIIREHIAKRFPYDGIIGEEFGRTPGTSGLNWIIDPIDGTTNFVNGIPVWTVVLAGVAEGKTQIGVIHDPVHAETFSALREHGARLNSQRLKLSVGKGLQDGTVAVGFSGGDDPGRVSSLVEGILKNGGMLIRNASGAISLAYVAAGRYIGFVEEHMNAWDCLAGQLLIEEAGGCIEEQNADEIIHDGGRIIAGTPEVFDDLKRIAETAWGS